MSIATREWQLVRRPHGEPVPADLRLVTDSRPGSAPGEVMVRTIAMSVDPYMRGFIVGSHADLRPEFVPTVAGWLRDGSVAARETVEGLDSAVDASLALLRGGSTRKMVVRLAPDPE